MSPRSFAAFATLILLLAGVVPAAGLGGVSAGTGAQSGAVAGASLAPHNTSLDPGDVEMRVEVAADGDAEWRVLTVVPVTDADDRRAFSDLVDEFNESGSSLDLGLRTFRAGAENASDVTGRSMEIENVERHHALHNETGALWITFTWTEFARTEGDRLVVDDAFNTSNGVWLPMLSEQDTLVVEPPRGYGVSSAPTGTSSAPSSLQSGVARWEGPQNFGARGPWIVYSGDASQVTPTTPTPNGPTATSPTSTADGPTAGPGTDPGTGDDGLQDLLPLAVLVLVAGVSVAAFAVYVRRDEDGLGGLVGGDDGGSGDDAAAEPAAEDGDDGATGTESTPDTDASVDDERAGVAAGAGAAAGAGGDVTASAGDAPDEDDGIDEELLSDEERVERLIERNGGRMKQAAIVQETGWSNAKVSQLLSAMDDDGRIDKLRIGRENLISFPDEDVTDLDSE